MRTSQHPGVADTVASRPFWCILGHTTQNCREASSCRLFITATPQSTVIDCSTVRPATPDAPAVVLLHGFPTSSHMFRNLVPALADRYHVIAPDHLGFGLSDAPPVEEFDYTFDALTDLTAGLLRTLGIEKYAMYVQDYGAPIGWRLALRDPSRDHGDHQPKRQRLRRRVRGELLEDRPGLSIGTDARQRGRGAAVPHAWTPPDGNTSPACPTRSLVDPESWYHDYALISRPGNDKVQLKLLRDYATNVPMYPRVQEYFRAIRCAAVGGMGSRRRDLRPSRRRSVCRRPARCRDPPSRWRALSAGVRAGGGRRVDPKLPRQGARARLTRTRGRHAPTDPSNGLDIPYSAAAPG